MTFFHPVVGFGALNLDRIFYVDRIVKPDEEGFISSVELHPGGSAANTVVGLSRLGVNTGYIGKVADDEGGKILLENFTSENVDVRGVRTGTGRSGTCLIMVDKKGNRGILVDPGVNDFVTVNDIDMDYIDTAYLVHMTSFICRDSEVSFKTQKYVAAMTRAMISLDPGTLYAEKGMAALLEFISRARVVMPNDRELELMTGCGDLREGAGMLLDAGAAWVAVKMGKRGCYVSDGNTEAEIPARQVEVVDTTGAGDAFNAGFIYGMLQGKDVMTCGLMGNITAASSITKRGACGGLPTRAEFEVLTAGL